MTYGSRSTAPPVSPKLPWYATVLLLLGVMVVALVRPFAPLGVIELALRTVGHPPSLELGNGKSLRLTEDRSLKTKCSVVDLHWSPGEPALVTACPSQLQISTLDGREIGKGVSPWPLNSVQLLSDPFTIVYLGKSEEPTVRDPVLALWSAKTGRSSVLPIHVTALVTFAVDQKRGRIGLVQNNRPGIELKLVDFDRGELVHTLPIPKAAVSLRWVPGSDALLLGGFDGVLRRIDVTSGEVRELAKPYAVTFPGGGGAQGAVGGLVLAPDGKAVAIFKRSGGILPAAGTNAIDNVAANKWNEELGTTVEIRSIDDGRLLDRMPGGPAVILSLVWDPRDRFIAAASSDALFLWQRKTGEVVVRTHDDRDRGISHWLSFSDDGSQLAFNTRDGLRIFRVEER